MSSNVPWSRIREFKEEQDRKRRKELEQAMGLPPGGLQQPGVVGGGGLPASGAAAAAAAAGAAAGHEEAAQGLTDRFSVPYFRERLLFGAICGAITGAFFGGLDAVQGIKKGQAFGVVLNSTKAKARFTAEHVGSASLVFGLFYSSYQGIKYVSRVARDEDDWGNPVTAALCTVAPLMVSATFRRNVPYALLLIGMDVVSDASSSSSSSSS